MLIAQFVSTLKTSVEQQQQGEKEKSKTSKSTSKAKSSSGKQLSGDERPLHLLRKVDVFVDASEVSGKVTILYFCS